MNKNVALGVMLVLMLVGFGLYFSTKNEVVMPVAQTSSTTVSVVTPPSSPSVGSTNAAPQAAPQASAEAPVVETKADVTPSDSTAIVTGRVKPNGAMTTYWFEYGESTALGSRSTKQGIGSGFSFITAPAYITGLRANTLYYFRLSAQNRLATVNGDTFSFKTTAAATTPAPKAAAPTVNTLAATDISRTAANISGGVNPNAYLTTYWFEYGKDNDLGNVTALHSGGSGVTLNTVTQALTNLEPLSKYYFRINAQNQYGTINGSIVSFTTAGPAASSKPEVNTRDASKVMASSSVLSGRINPNGADTTYWFEYSEDSLLGSIIGGGTAHQMINAGTDAVIVSENIAELKPNTKYYYRLVGKNQHGTVSGNITSFKTKP